MTEVVRSREVWCERTEKVESRARLSLRTLKERLDKILNVQLKGEK